MTGKLRLDQIPFGTLNNISDAGGPSTDRRRTDPLEFLRLSTEAAFSRDALANKDSFEGIVIARKQIHYPSVKNKSTLFREFILKEAQVSTPTPESGSAGANAGETDDYPTFVYKVYIPELEPRPIPRGTNDPIIATYADVYSDVNSTDEGINIGALVRVIYEDVGSLYGPKISSVVGTTVQLAGFEESQSLDSKFKGSISVPLDSATPEKKNLKGSEIKQIANRRPDFTGPTPNADKLREALRELGYSEKGTEISNAGDIKEIMADVGIAVLKEIKKQLPSVAITVTGGNDKYHKVIKDAGMYTSRHTRGLALDIVFAPVNQKNKDPILAILQGFSAVNKPFRFLDEYEDLTPAATGPHFHFSYALGTEGDDEQSEAEGLLALGLIKGFPIGGTT